MECQNFANEIIYYNTLNLYEIKQTYLYPHTPRFYNPNYYKMNPQIPKWRNKFPEIAQKVNIRLEIHLEHPMKSLDKFMRLKRPIKISSVKTKYTLKTMDH